MIPITPMHRTKTGNDVVFRERSVMIPTQIDVHAMISQTKRRLRQIDNFRTVLFVMDG